MLSSFPVPVDGTTTHPIAQERTCQAPLIPSRLTSNPPVSPLGFTFKTRPANQITFCTVTITSLGIATASKLVLQPSPAAVGLPHCCQRPFTSRNLMSVLTTSIKTQCLQALKVQTITLILTAAPGPLTTQSVGLAVLDHCSRSNLQDCSSVWSFEVSPPCLPLPG